MKKNFLKYFIFFLSCLILVAIDQITKKLASKYLFNKSPKILIDNILEFVYVENRGAAFGILQNKQVFFYVLTIFVLIYITICIIKLNFSLIQIPYYICLILIFSGAVGNFIDRITNKYVVDFIYFKPIDFPVFNFADIYISIGCIFLIISVMFIYKGDNL